MIIVIIVLLVILYFVYGGIPGHNKYDAAICVMKKFQNLCRNAGESLTYSAPYFFNGTYADIAVSMCFLYNAKYLHCFNIVRDGGYYIPGAKKYYFKNREDLGKFLDRIKTDPERCRAVFGEKMEKPRLLIYRFVLPACNAFLMNEEMDMTGLPEMVANFIEVFKKRRPDRDMMEGVMEKYGTVDIATIYEKVRNDGEFYKTFDELPELMRALQMGYTFFGRQPVFCKKPKDLIPLEKADIDGLEITNVMPNTKPLFDIPHDIFEKGRDFVFYRRAGRFSFTLPDRCAVKEGHFRSLMTVADFDRLPHSGLKMHMKTLAERADAAPTDTVQITRYLFRGIKSHLDNGKYTDIKTINIGPTIYYDMHPFLMPAGTKPVRVVVKPGDMVVLKKDAFSRWAHSIPDFICENYEKFSVVFRKRGESGRVALGPIPPGYISFKKERKPEFSIYEINAGDMANACTKALRTLSAEFKVVEILGFLHKYPENSYAAYMLYLLGTDYRLKLRKLTINIKNEAESVGAEFAGYPDLLPEMETPQDFAESKKKIEIEAEKLGIGYTKNCILAFLALESIKPGEFSEKSVKLNGGWPLIYGVSFEKKNLSPTDFTDFAIGGTKPRKLEQKTVFTVLGRRAIISFKVGDSAYRVILKPHAQLILPAGAEWQMADFQCHPGVLRLATRFGK
jgi:hypothetical protein